MANPEHVEIAQKGAAAIREWKSKHPTEPFDLSSARLAGIDLSNADLSDAILMDANIREAKLANIVFRKAKLHRIVFEESDLSHADFTRAISASAMFHRTNLSHANLSEASFFGAYFPRSNLHGAYVSGVDLTMAFFVFSDLTETDFSRSDFSFANLIRSKLIATNLSNADVGLARFLQNDMDQVNFTGAKMNGTSIEDSNLNKCVGLETVVHEGPSSISFDTLVRSFKGAGCKLTSEMQLFFANAGVPTQLLHDLPRILAEVKYCSCFICYGQPDVNLATRLVDDLRAKGVSCWLYDMDATPGKKTWGEITIERREKERMIVLCSIKALVRDGVKKEIEE